MKCRCRSMSKETINSSLRKTNMKAATLEELAEGQKKATLLLSLLKDVLSSPENQSAAELLVDVVGCFAKALSFLELERVETDEPPQQQSDPAANSRPCSDEQRSDRDWMKGKIRTPRKTNYRGRTYPYSCRTILSAKIEDGYPWHKYGEREIYGTEHPRSYYKCIHKNDRCCKATKHVQKTEEDDSIFVITYIGEHTCIDKSHYHNNSVVGDGDAVKEAVEEVRSTNHSSDSSSTWHRPLLLDLAPLTTAEGSSSAAFIMPDSVSGHRGSLSMEITSGVFELEDLFAFYKDEE